MPDELTAEQIAAIASTRGLPIDAARAEAFRAGLNSLLARVRRLGDLIPPETSPPPNQAPR